MQYFVFDAFGILEVVVVAFCSTAVEEAPTLPKLRNGLFSGSWVVLVDIRYVLQFLVWALLCKLLLSRIAMVSGVVDARLLIRPSGC